MSLKHALPNKALLNQVLALVLLLASVAVASHVHEEPEIETSDEQVENCFIYHQFQSHDHTLPSLAELFQTSETHTQVALLSANAKTNRHLPPARAPPTVS